MKRAIVVAALCVAGCAPEGRPMEAEGVVVRTDGWVEAREGDPCAVRIEDESRRGYPCRLTVECRGRPLYGGALPGGFVRGRAEGGAWAHVFDHEIADGDPWVDYDVRRGVVEVRTARGDVEVHVEPRSGASLTASARVAGR